MAIQERVIQYDGGGLSCEGYLAFDGDKRSAPGVLICHAWFGLQEHERMRARMLAELGYSAFSLDVYGAGLRPDNPADAGAAMMPLVEDAPRLRARLQAGLDTLRAQPEVNASSCAVMGYCFGGRCALELARTGADLRAAVSFHGFFDTALPAGPGDIKATVLACHGSEDPMVDDQQVLRFMNEMRACGADWNLHVYGGAGHAFTLRGSENFGIPGLSFNEKADARSWIHLKKLLREKMG